MSRPTIRPEQPIDRAAVRRVNERAFGQPAEADLVEALRRAGAASVALVAERDGEVVGHIVLSPVEVDPATERRIAGLAPMAVSPPHQGGGIGGALVRAALERAREAGFSAVVVLGHPGYYPRFGFARADAFGLRWEHDAPPEAFMALELEDGALDGVTGVVRFHRAFDGV